MATITNTKLSLDKLQREAAQAPEGPVLIMGGPGTGKTRTLIGRILNLLKADVSPHNIAYVTFSSRGADDMRRQISDYVASRHIYIGTLHQYASQFLRHTGAALIGLTPHYTIWDQEQSLEIIAELIESEKRDQDESGAMSEKEIKEILHWHSLNQADRSGAPLPAQNTSWLQIIEMYKREKLRQNVLDLDDLIPSAIQVMESSPQIQASLNRSRTRHLLVDEFQDITPSQYRLLRLMTGPTHSITIASDPNQSIYTWRGADTRLLDQFRLDHHDTSTHLLRINHRSTKTLTDAAANMTTHKSMNGLHDAYQTAIRPEGPRPALLEFQGDPGDMDEYILDWAQELVGRGYAWEDLACIYRKHFTSSRMITKLVHRDIPYTVLGDTRNPEQGDARCITNLLSCLINPLDSKAFAIAASTEAKSQRRRLNPGATRQLVRLSRDQNINLVEAAEQYLQVTKRNSAIHANLRYLISAWRTLSKMLEDPETTIYNICRRAHSMMNNARGSTSMPIPDKHMTKLLTLSESNERLPGESPRQHLSRFLELITAAPYPDYRSLNNDDPFAHHKGLTFSTIHAAKGIQWKVVWVIDASDHIIPGPVKDTAYAESRLQEEQRIFYVAATRGADQLYFCSAVGGNKGFDAVPCRFLEAWGDSLVYERV